MAGQELRFAQTLPAAQTQVQVRLRATDLAGLTVEQSLTLPVVEPKLRINEFLAGNSSGLTDENLEPQDWIELFNEQPQTIDLTGWYLTDDRDEPDQVAVSGADDRAERISHCFRGQHDHGAGAEWESACEFLARPERASGWRWSSLMA